MNSALILASQSPRRKTLLSQLGYEFSCLPADIDEATLCNESPENYVLRMAITKAKVIVNRSTQESTVLGADTCVVLDNEILSKPINQQAALTILLKLSGRTHQVLTAIAVINSGKEQSRVVKTQVTFKTLTEQEIIKYWQTGEPQDKAGSYAIQGLGGQFVTHISGSYSAVVGLPLYETANILTAFNIKSALYNQG